MCAQDTAFSIFLAIENAGRGDLMMPILRSFQNLLQTEFWHAVCAKRQRVRCRIRLTSDMYAQDTSLCRKALSKIRRKVSDLTPIWRVT